MGGTRALGNGVVVFLGESDGRERAESSRVESVESEAESDGTRDERKKGKTRTTRRKRNGGDGEGKRGHLGRKAWNGWCHRWSRRCSE